MSEVSIIGLSYRTAPLSLREELAMSKDMVMERLTELRRRCHVPEAAIVSTCNRTEVYCLSAAPQRVADWLDATVSGKAAAHLYCLTSQDAVRHLFRVTCGLDSQLVGEPEITGQIKHFAELARRNRFSGVIINRLLEHALAAAKDVRSSTDIGRHSLSYTGLAARAAAGIFPDLRDTAVLFVGVSDMTFAGGAVFADRGVRAMAVAGRAPDKTEKAAARIGGVAVPMSRLPDVLADYDIVISSTASQVPIIGKGAVESAMRRRRHKPMMFADLAVPRDLEAEIQELPDVFVYDLDQFGAMAEAGRVGRQAAAVQASAIIEQRVDDFWQWLSARRNVGSVRSLRENGARVCDAETAAALARLAGGAAPDAVVRDLARRLTGQLLHLPTTLLRDAAEQESAASESERVAEDEQ